MKIDIHETLMNLNRGRITVNQAHDEIKSAMCEVNAQSVLSDVLTDEEVEDLEVRLYNHALSVICSELTAEERTRSRNNIIREWFGEMCSRYVR